MTAQPLVIWGASGHARVVADIVRLRGDFEIVGFVDDTVTSAGPSVFSNAPVLGGRSVLESLYRDGVRHCFVAVGDPRVRMQLAEYAERAGFVAPILVHPAAIVAHDTTIGRGTVLMAGAIVNSGAKIANQIIINTAATIDHESVLDYGCVVSPGAHLAGNVSVARGAWIGIGAVVKERIEIGEFATVGAGAVVIRNVPAGTVVYGVPARPRTKVAAE